MINHAERIIENSLKGLALGGQRILVLIPDTTRTAPVGSLVKMIYRTLNGRCKALDILIALGTHPPLSSEAILQHFALTQEQYATVVVQRTWVH